VAGLITEASPLTYPENASVDEDNTVITRRGNRRRRLGIDVLPDFDLSPFAIDQQEAASSVIREYFWTNVANRSPLRFLCLQVADTLHFYDVSDGNRYPEKKSFTVDLTPFYLTGSPVSVAQTPVSMAAGRGSLFVTGEFFEPFFVRYDLATDTISATKITILIRDFVGVEDGLATAEEPTTLSIEHNYNLFNQGWINPTQTNTGTAVVSYDSLGAQRTTNQTSTVISAYQSSQSRFPSNSQVWWGGKDADEVFDPTVLVKQYFGNTRAPRGHYVVEAFNIDRDAVSGLSGVPGDESRTRPKAVGFFSGRVWYGHDNDVYFSQVLEDSRQAGNCYQEADPTSEYLSDLIDSDGGQIPIPEAVDIKKLVSYGNGILVFADNGVWNVQGTDANGFTARDYSVSKISSIGLEGAESVVDTGQSIFWWSKIGIQALQQNQGMFGPIGGSFNTSNITESTIQTFYNEEISSTNRPEVKGRFDPTSNTVQWLFASNGAGRNFYNRVLNYDMTLEAFYPWTLGTGPQGPHLCGSYVSQAINESRRNRLTRYIALVPDGDDFRVAFCAFTSFTFSDWATLGPQQPYRSFILTGFEMMDDAMRDKELSHIHTFFTRTETAFIDEGDGDYRANLPSSCLFRAKWDWADTATSGKWSRQVEAYRHRRMPNVDPDDLKFDTGYEVVISKNRIRGHGRAVQFEFSSDKIGHDFDLLGWSVQFTGNSRV
jgi:hypothetical protein